MAVTGEIVPHRAAITICVMLATLMQALDTTIANVALPYMQGSLSASQDQINWVLTSYIVAAAIMTPPTGWLAARFGRTRLFLGAVIGFTLASVACGIAQSLDQMVLFRLAQGVFGAALVPLSQAVLLDIYPVEKQGAAMALWGVGVMVGPILGPTLGGWLTADYNWRWVFFINVPIGVITWLGLTTFLKETSFARSTAFDWFGFTMLSVGIGALQLMLDRGEQLDWFSSTEIIVETAIAGLCLYSFLVHFLTAKDPFISPALFKDRNFSMGMVCIFMLGVILLASLALMTPFLQTLMGYPALTAGAVLSPRGIGTMAAMVVVGKAVGKVDTRVLILAGLVMTAHSLYIMMGFTADVSEWVIILSGFEQGVGIGFMFVPLSTVTFATLAPELRTQGTGIFSLMRNVGSAIGISIVVTLLQDNTQANHAEIAGYVTPFNQLFQSGVAGRLLNPNVAGSAALLDAQIQRQAATIAYIDDFKLMMIVCLVTMPMVLLLRAPKKAAGGHAVLE